MARRRGLKVTRLIVHSVAGTLPCTAFSIGHRPNSGEEEMNKLAKDLEALTGQIEELLSQDELSADDEKKLAELEAEADKLTAEIEKIKALDDRKAKNAARQQLLTSGVGRKSEPETLNHQDEKESFGVPAYLKSRKSKVYEDVDQAYLCGRWAAAAQGAEGRDERRCGSHHSSPAAGLPML